MFGEEASSKKLSLIFFLYNPRNKKNKNHTPMCNKIIFTVCRNKQSCRIKGRGVGGKTEAVPPDGARGWERVG